MKSLLASLLLMPAFAFSQATTAPAAEPAQTAAPAAGKTEAKGGTEAGTEAKGAGPAVEDAKLGTGVLDREPQGVADTFKSDVGKVYCWTKVTGAEGTDITHVWYKGDETMAEVKLAVKYPSTRTWSAKTIPAGATGEWRVDVVAADGTVMKTLTFHVE